MSLIDWLFISRRLFFRVPQVKTLRSDLIISAEPGPWHYSASRGQETLRDRLTPKQTLTARHADWKQKLSLGEENMLPSAHVPYPGRYPKHQAPWEASPVNKAHCEPGESKDRRIAQKQGLWFLLHASTLRID